MMLVLLLLIRRMNCLFLFLFITLKSLQNRDGDADANIISATHTLYVLPLQFKVNKRFACEIILMLEYVEMTLR